MAAEATLVTGFPGFIAGRLVDALLQHSADRRFLFLVQDRFVFEARSRCEAIAEKYPGFTWQIIEGDITRPDLGMPAPALDQVRRTVGDVWHLAALYDLAVPQAVAYRVNVDGTQNVLDLCASLDRLTAHNYISTCYVAGDRTGRVFEDELDAGQGFKNHYESTKFWAEKQVRRRIADLPTRIFRPAIVVGDSTTGETVKGDGPYYVMSLLFRLPRWVPMAHLGPCQAPVNLVPVDWLVEAMASIAAQETTLGKTFQLADPDPPNARQVMLEFLDILDRAGVVGTVPLPLASRLMRRRTIQRLTGISEQTFAYFNHPVGYDVANTSAALRNRGRPCPPLFDYLPTLVDFAQHNPSVLGRAA